MSRSLRSSSGKSATAAAKSKSADAKSLLRLPTDAVSTAFLYLDVDGIPKAAVMCKEWNAILKSVEEELWLSLIRKHCPIAERIARKLPPPAIASSADGGDEEDGDDGNGQEPPAKRGRIAIDWKDQFRRAREMSKQDEVPSPEPTTITRPEPKPLSSYFFQVDLILYKGVKGKKKSEWEKLGVVSTIVDGDNLKFNGNNSIVLSVKSEDIADELSKYSFTSFDIKLVLFEKSTGKRGFFYQGGLDDQCDPNDFILELSKVTSDVYDPKFSFIDSDVPCAPWIGCMLFVSKNGCICDCHHGQDWGLFVPPSTCPCCDHVCKCCSCKRKGKGSKWSCFWGMDIELFLEVWWEWDSVTIDGKEEQLEILENVKFS